MRKVIGFGHIMGILCVPVSSILYCNDIVLLQFLYLSTLFTLLQLLCMQLNSPDQLKITRMIYIYMFMYSHLDNAHHQYVCISLAYYKRIEKRMKFCRLTNSSYINIHVLPKSTYLQNLSVAKEPQYCTWTARKRKPLL